jgi:hypothetical protein
MSGSLRQGMNSDTVKMCAEICEWAMRTGISAEKSLKGFPEGDDPQALRRQHEHELARKVVDLICEEEDRVLLGTRPVSKGASKHHRVTFADASAVQKVVRLASVLHSEAKEKPASEDALVERRANAIGIPVPDDEIARSEILGPLEHAEPKKAARKLLWKLTPPDEAKSPSHLEKVESFLRHEYDAFMRGHARSQHLCLEGETSGSQLYDMYIAWQAKNFGDADKEHTLLYEMTFLPFLSFIKLLKRDVPVVQLEDFFDFLVRVVLHELPEGVLWLADWITTDYGYARGENLGPVVQSMLEAGRKLVENEEK